MNLSIPTSSRLLRRLVTAALFAWLSAASCLNAADAPAVPLVSEAKPTAALYVAATPSPGSIEGALELAVTEINYHLKQMTGADLKVIRTDDPDEVQAPAVVLGELAVRMGARPESHSASREGFRILNEKGRVLIGGESDDGTLFGAYALLRGLGCDWVMPGPIGEIIPRRPSVAVAAMDRSEAPGFLIRTQYYGGGPRVNGKEEKRLFDQWARRHARGDYDHPAMSTRGHYWPQLIRKHKNEFDANPGMYALVALPDGSLVRRGPQLESTHPRVIELMAQDIRDTFEKNRWPKDKAAGFPIGPADGSAFSQSQESREANSGRTDPMSAREDVTDLMVLLGNRVLEKLGDEYPNVWVGYYVYAQYSGFPLKYKPHPRLVPILASINYSRHYSSVDPRSRTRGSFRKAARQWGNLAKEQGTFIISRDFNYNLADGLSPVTKIAVWGEEIPFYHKIGVAAFVINSAKAWAIYGPQNYLLQRLMWNPGLDWKAVLSEYCRYSFGEGAAAMDRYFNRLVQTQKDAGQEAGSYLALPLIFDGDFMRKSRDDLDQALRAATTPEDKTRIGYIADGLHSLELYLAYYRATCDFDFIEAAAQLKAMIDHQHAMMTKNQSLATLSAPRYLERFLKPFVEGAKQHSTDPYQLVERLPDELPTCFDPHLVGAEMEYFAPAINERRWLKTKTYSSTWDAQGLGNLRNGKIGGAVWYRWRFAATPGGSDRRLGLLLGGFDDEARVWLNGRLIGSSGRAFSKPAVYDLAENVQRGENVLVIEVLRNSPLNELGAGGLLRPSFLFSGPRLARRANVLPEEMAETARAEHLQMFGEGEQAY